MPGDLIERQCILSSLLIKTEHLLINLWKTVKRDGGQYLLRCYIQFHIVIELLNRIGISALSVCPEVVCCSCLKIQFPGGGNMKVMEKVESQTGQKSSLSSELHFPTTVKAIRDNIIHHLMSFQGRDPERSGAKDVYKALAYTMRDIMVEKWIIEIAKIETGG